MADLGVLDEQIGPLPVWAWAIAAVAGIGVGWWVLSNFPTGSEGEADGDGEGEPERGSTQRRQSSLAATGGALSAPGAGGEFQIIGDPRPNAGSDESTDPPDPEPSPDKLAARIDAGSRTAEWLQATSMAGLERQVADWVAREQVRCHEPFRVLEANAGVDSGRLQSAFEQACEPARRSVRIDAGPMPAEWLSATSHESLEASVEDWVRTEGVACSAPFRVLDSTGPVDHDRIKAAFQRACKG